MPYDRLAASGSDIINRYLAKASIEHKAGDGKSFHAFRRTVGTRLVKAKVPLPSIAQVLIHNKMDSSKRYISLDDESLRVCCLDISALETTKGGLQ
jgi:integrase